MKNRTDILGMLIRLEFVLICVFLISCGDSMKNVEEPCTPLPVVDGHIFVKTYERETLLRLPRSSDVLRSSNKEGKGCDYFRSLSNRFYWYDEKLNLPSNDPDKKHHQKHRYLVKTYFRGELSFQEESSSRKPVDDWKYEPAYQHSKYPLELYPHYEWDHPESPSKLSLSLAKKDTRWGVTNTEHKNVINQRNHETSCTMERTEDMGSHEKDPLSIDPVYCRGHVTVRKGDIVLGFMVDVRASKDGYNPIKDLNLIYDSLVEEFGAYIVEQ